MTSDSAAYFPASLAGNPDTAIAGHRSESVHHAQPEGICSAPSTRDHRTDELLITELGRGCKEVLGVLFRRHRRIVSNVALRILKDPSEAEDLCQEVFLYLFQKARLFDASKGTASSWIIQIAYHRAINRRQYLGIRQHYTAQEINKEQVPAGREGLFISEIDAREILNRLRGELSPEQRHTLELFFFEGYSLREIADKTSQTIGNVRHQYYRGLERLRAGVFPKKGRLSERIGTKRAGARLNL
jgi:RNA polymerase sigma-70 factor (ECF subfamily)